MLGFWQGHGTTVLIDMLTARATGSGEYSLASGDAAGLKRLAPVSGFGELIGVEGVIKRLVSDGSSPWLRTESSYPPS